MPRAKEGNPACKPTLTNNNWQLPDNELHKSSSPLPPRTPAILSDCPVLTRPKTWTRSPGPGTPRTRPTLPWVMWKLISDKRVRVSRPNASGRRGLTPRQFSFAGLEIGDWDWGRGVSTGTKQNAEWQWLPPEGSVDTVFHSRWQWWAVLVWFSTARGTRAHQRRGRFYGN